MSWRIEFAVGLIALLLVSKGICAENTVEDPVLRKGTDDPWSTIETENFTIYYAKDFAGDAQRAKTYLNSTIESMVKEFSEYEPEEILTKVGCHFYLHPEPNEKASDGRSVCM